MPRDHDPVQRNIVELTIRTSVAHPATVKVTHPPPSRCNREPSAQHDRTGALLTQMAEVPLDDIPVRKMPLLMRTYSESPFKLGPHH